MAKLFNRAKMTTSTTGSGTVTLGGASVGYQSFADAGVSDGDVVQYVIEEGGNFEIGTGTYSATGTSLTRSPTESSNSNAAISLGGAATVSITAVADDLNRLQYEGSTKVAPTSTGATVTGNLAVTGTVDGRDVATDGTKLDGIEAGADVTDTANVTAAGALMDSEVTNLAQVKAFDSSDYATAAQGTTADAALARSGGTMTGAITFASGQTFDGRDVSADGSKLDGIESGATADQTAAEIRSLVESATDSNVFTDADHTKLNGIESGATADQTAAQILTAIKTVDGSGSGLDADTLDGSHASAFLTGNQTITLSGDVSGSGTTSINVTVANDSHTHDGRYYTETEADSRFVNVTGDTITGALTLSQNNTDVLNFTATSTNDNRGISFNSKTALTADSSDGYLRLNNASEFSNGVYTPGVMRADGGFNVNGSTVWHSSNDGSGSGLDADLLDGYNTSTGEIANTVAVRQANGYLFATYFNGSGTYSTSGLTSGMGLFSGTNGSDNYGRTYTAAAARALLNVENGATADQTITAGSGLTGGGTGNVTISHADTSSQASVNNSGRTYIQDITLDTYGHITGITSATETVVNTNTTYSAGTGLDLSGTTFSIESDLRGEVTLMGNSTSNYIQSTNTKVAFYFGGLEEFRFDSSGNLHADGNVVTNSTTISSDENLKDNIKIVDGALSKLHQLRGVTFDWKRDGQSSAGVIAQDVMKVMPEAVLSVEGLKNNESHLTVNYSALTSILIEAIKEQQEQIDALKKQLNG